MPGVEALARAKVNLTLRVTGRRADGYHLLDSLVAFADIGDRVRVRQAESLSLEISGPFASGLSAGPDNLVWRAAVALAAACGRTPGVAIELEKILPIASGIGGGSADAAATLSALAQLWQVSLSADQWQALALSLGADVPVCLAGQACRMTGIGETLTPFALAPQPALLVNAGLPVETGAVFRTRPPGFSAPLEPNGDPIALIRAGGNDLQASAIALCPVIAEVLAELSALPEVRIAQMSGSGGTCFAITRDAEAAAAVLRARHPTWWIAATTLS